MCILFIYTNPKPEANGYRLIIASNRDEFYRRPAKKAFLCEDTNIIGGRDMEGGREGGMWLGAVVKGEEPHKKICFGALLNVTGEDRKSVAQGRGFVVTDYLRSEAPLDDYLQTLDRVEHNAFNFVSVELSKDDALTVHYSNAPNSRDVYKGQQVLGFGNSTTKSPLTKVRNGKQKFQGIIDKNQGKEELIKELIALLKCSDRHLPDEELQRRAPSAYEFLSSIYVKIEEGGYGTRTHSVLIVDYDGDIYFEEHTMKEPITDVNNPEWEITKIKSHL